MHKAPRPSYHNSKAKKANEVNRRSYCTCTYSKTAMARSLRSGSVSRSSSFFSSPLLPSFSSCRARQLCSICRHKAGSRALTAWYKACSTFLSANTTDRQYQLRLTFDISGQHIQSFSTQYRTCHRKVLVQFEHGLRCVQLLFRDSAFATS